MNGIINVLKPPGMSSSGVVSYIRKITGEKRVGHAGTLDPGAAGVLPVCIGRSTRLTDMLMENRKEYIAEITFGVSTDTLDSYGVVLETAECNVTEDMIGQAIPQFIGDIMQTPPAYSALKINGTPSYKLARKGEAVQKPARAVKVYELEYLGMNGKNRHMIRVLCSKGTYIRVICEDIGKVLGVPAHMSFLLRSQSGGQRVENAFTCDELGALAEQNDFSFIIPPENVLCGLKRIDIPKRFRSMILNGIAIRNIDLPEGDYLVYCDNEFLGVGENCEGAKIRIPLYEMK